MNIKKIVLSLFAGAIGASVLTVSSMATAFVSEDADRIWGQQDGLQIDDSYVIEIYSGDTKIASTSLNDVNNFIDGSVKDISWFISTKGETDEYWTTKWEEGNPSIARVPTTAVHYVDGELHATEEVQMNNPDNLNKTSWDKIEGVAGIAKIGDEDYMTLQAAFDAAQDGDTIVLVEDVVITSEEAGSSGEGSNKFYMGVFYTGNKSFTFDMNGYSVSASNDDGVDNNVFRLRNLTDKDNVIYIKNGTIVADDIYYALDVGYSGTAKTTLNIENVDFIVTRGKAYVLYARYNSIVNAKNVTIDSEGSGAFIADYAEMTLDNCEAVVTGLIKNYPWNSIAVAAMGTPTSITVNGGSFTTYTTNKDSRMLSVVGVMSSGGNIIINGGEFTQVDENNVGGSYSLMYCDSEKGKESYITVNDGTFTAVKSLMQWNSSSPAGTSLVSLKGGKYNVKPVGNVGALCQVAEGFTLLEYSDGGYAVVADEFIGNETITVDFVDVTETDAEGEKVYNINLVADAEKIINRLNSADLTFVLNVDSGEIDYEIVDIADDNIVINPVDNSKNRYEFHFETKTDVTNDTDDVITIAQVKFTGYGTFDFAVDTNANETNAVHATEILDNIVDTYVPAGTTTDTTVGELIVADDDITDITIKVPTRVLTINVDFPNSVEKNAVAYQQMTVKVSGGDLTKDIVINLGDTAVESEAIDLENEKPEANFSVNVATADKYVVTVAKALTVNTSYNVEVSGEGYRTARYTVTMNCEESKTLNFWNNVKDNDTLVEEKKDSSAKKVTFLAGDIVKDSLINIYDLSAVVSYFGENMDTAKYNDYAKYDLNRDGKIDSKDVAYVLVSWGK